MQLIFDSGGGDHEVDLRVNDPAATVADLAAALGGTPGGGLLVGEHFARGDLALRVAPTPAPPSRSPRERWWWAATPPPAWSWASAPSPAGTAG
jgi:hypothetical protein